MICTVRRLVPISANSFWMLVVIPLPRPTMTITAITPMMMPSMVRNVRNLLLQMFWMASRKVS